MKQSLGEVKRKVVSRRSAGGGFYLHRGEETEILTFIEHQICLYKGMWNRQIPYTRWEGSISTGKKLHLSMKRRFETRRDKKQKRGEMGGEDKILTSVGTGIEMGNSSRRAQRHPVK